MEILRARTAGFCMGVSLALRRLDGVIHSHAGEAGRIVMLGPVIHNPQVLEEYARRGVVRVNTVEEVQPGDRVIIRAHGLPLPEETALRAAGAQVMDATCPKVKKAQNAIAEATAGGAPLLLFGEREHPEVRGLVSYACGPCRVFSTARELFAQPLPQEKGLVLAAQTTQDEGLFHGIVAELHNRGTELRVLSTICHATSKRQQEAVDIARKVDMMVVLGGRESGNTRRLADVASAGGVPTLLVETLEELINLDGWRTARRIGLTAGASTPKNLVDVVHEFLKNISA